MLVIATVVPVVAVAVAVAGMSAADPPPAVNTVAALPCRVGKVKPQELLCRLPERDDFAHEAGRLGRGRPGDSSELRRMNKRLSASIVAQALCGHRSPMAVVVPAAHADSESVE